MRVNSKAFFLIMSLVIVFMIIGCDSEEQAHNGQTNGDAGTDDIADDAAVDVDDDYVVQVAFFDCDMMTPCPISYHGGIYEEMGVNAEITMTDQVGVLMAAGQLDVGYMGSNAMNNALNQGTPVKMVAFNHLGGSYYVVGSNELETPEDLIGKKINMGPDSHDINPEWRIMAHGMISIGFIGALLDYCFRVLEQKKFAWQKKTR